jgi:hypothetical protein
LGVRSPHYRAARFKLYAAVTGVSLQLRETV